MHTNSNNQGAWRIKKEKTGKKLKGLPFLEEEQKGKLMTVLSIYCFQTAESKGEKEEGETSKVYSVKD